MTRRSNTTAEHDWPSIALLAVGVVGSVLLFSFLCGLVFWLIATFAVAQYMVALILTGIFVVYVLTCSDTSK